mmetsp:Transcript_28849/g.88451  ORF Transcript_28849/g.88451 Transcript_28849/m.88451 type:complete len:283 (+) Transcript_28849:1901-2749(+)
MARLTRADGAKIPPCELRAEEPMDGAGGCGRPPWASMYALDGSMAGGCLVGLAPLPCVSSSLAPHVELSPSSPEPWPPHALWTTASLSSVAATSLASTRSPLGSKDSPSGGMGPPFCSLLMRRTTLSITSGALILRARSWSFRASTSLRCTQLARKKQAMPLSNCTPTPIQQPASHSCEGLQMRNGVCLRPGYLIHEKSVFLLALTNSQAARSTSTYNACSSRSWSKFVEVSEKCARKSRASRSSSSFITRCSFGAGSSIDGLTITRGKELIGRPLMLSDGS